MLDGSLAFDGLAVDQDMRWVFLTGLAAAGRADEARIAEELARDNTISGQEHAAGARAARPDAAAKAEAWEAAVVSGDTPNETQRSIVFGFMRYGQDDVLTPYVDRYLEAAHDMWERLGRQRGSVALEFVFPRPLASQELLDKVDAWLETTDADAVAKRFVAEGRSDVVRYLAGQAKDAEPS